MNYQKVAARVLARIKVMYPLFANQISSDPEMMMLAIDEWANGLKGMDIKNVERGLEMVRRSRSDFAPSLPKFIDYCGGRAKPWWETMEGYIERGKQLGIEEKDFIRKHEFISLVKNKARASGEELPLNKEEEKEALPKGALKLIKGMKIDRV
jgi:hypothetical protein